MWFRLRQPYSEVAWLRAKVREAREQRDAYYFAMVDAVARADRAEEALAKEGRE